MPAPAESTEALAKFCGELRQLRKDSGLQLSALSARINRKHGGRNLSPSRASEIERGIKIRNAPDWAIISAWVDVCRAAAANEDRPMSIPTDVAYWRHKHKRLTEILERSTAPIEAAEQIPRQLGPKPSQFTGREDEVRKLTHMLGEQVTDPAVAVVSGMAGIGKTGLALHWAHQVSNQFPDGQLFRDLRGYSQDEEPLSPKEVIGDWLASVWGIDRVPKGLDERMALFRSKIAGKRMLLVLDNAATADQIRPLLPANDSCFVIVTSRERLDGLITEGAHLMSLDVLSPVEARELLYKVIGERVNADEQATNDLAKLCAYLPLALRVAGSRAASDPNVSVADLARQLADEQRRLRRLGNRDDPRTNVRAVFSWSYRGLPKETQRAFRLLGLHPAAGQTTDIFAVSVLLDSDLDSASEQIDLLQRRSLVGRSANGRFRMHDLLRLYSKELVEQPEFSSDRRAALERLAHAYYGCVNHAFDRQNQNNPMVDHEYLSTWRQAVSTGVEVVDTASSVTSWFATEQGNLLALAEATADNGLELASQFATSLFYFLEIGGHLEDWGRVEEVGARTASTRADRARSLRNRGRLAMIEVQIEQERLKAEDEPAQVGSCEQAIALLEQSRDLYRAEYLERGGRQARAGEATTLRELADAYRLEVDQNAPGGAIQKAIDAYRAAEAVYVELKNENGLASLRLALGIAYRIDGQDDEARQCFQAALKYGASTDERGKVRHGRLKGFSLRRLAELRRDQGKLKSAVNLYGRCAEAFRHDVNDPGSRAHALAARGRVQKQLGDIISAGRSLMEAYELLVQRPLGEDDPEARVVAGWLSRLDDDQ